jgi:hypothetical protein
VIPHCTLHGGWVQRRHQLQLHVRSRLSPVGDNEILYKWSQATMVPLCASTDIVCRLCISVLLCPNVANVVAFRTVVLSDEPVSLTPESGMRTQDIIVTKSG